MATGRVRQDSRMLEVTLAGWAATIGLIIVLFAIDLFVRERFNLVIGGVFLAIVLFSPDGLLGLWAKLRSSLVKTKPSLN